MIVFLRSLRDVGSCTKNSSSSGCSSSGGSSTHYVVHIFLLSRRPRFDFVHLIVSHIICAYFVVPYARSLCLHNVPLLQYSSAVSLLDICITTIITTTLLLLALLLLSVANTKTLVCQVAILHLQIEV